MMKRRLFSPGPTPVPEEVLLSIAQPMQHHRLLPFRETFARASELLKNFFKTEEPVLTLTTSGTGSMEAAVSNLLSPGDEAIVVKGGKFSERWGAICEAYGIKVLPIDLEWGKSVKPADVRAVLDKHPGAGAVFTTYTETSTGALTDIKGVADVLGGTSTLLVVDGITGIGVHDFRFDEWGVDAAVTGSQKGLMIPPGLAFIALSKKARENLKSSQCSRYYLDLGKYFESFEKGQNPFTPAISLINGLSRALETIFEEGLEEIFRRHQRLGDATRAAVGALGLQLLPEIPCNVLTALWIPGSIDGIELLNYMRDELGVMVAGGQGHLTGKIIRIGHVGYFDDFDMLTAIAALERALLHCGYDHETGAGLVAAHKEFIKSY